MNPTQMMNGGMHNMNSQAMIDNFKSMAMTMLMFKNSNNTTSNDNSSFINTIIMMLVITCIDSIAIQLKHFIQLLTNKINQYISKQATNVSLINSLSNSILKLKKASIIIKIEPATASRNPTSDAIVDLITHFPHTKCILLQNGMYNINYGEEIEIHKHLFVKLTNSPVYQPDVVYKNDDNRKNAISNNNINNINTNNIVSTDGQPETPPNNGYGYIELYSYNYDMEALRKELNDIVNNYLIKMNNKLGNNIYYFRFFHC